MSNLSENAKLVLKKRYLQNGESPRDLFKRVAVCVANGDAELEKPFFDMMNNLEFLPNTPTLVNAGRKDAQLSACFVLPIQDSIISIFDTLKNTALIHKSGGGTGFSFSSLRPAGSCVSESLGISSGPLSFMSIYDEATNQLKQGGVRRGANMGSLFIDHPDIIDFINAKNTEGNMSNFNLSVAITDSFMNSVLQGKKEFILSFSSKTMGKAESTKVVVDTQYLWNALIKSCWTNGEPGVLFIDRINKFNPLSSIETIYTTNPCGEQPLPSYGSCFLGSINLSKFVLPDGGTDYEKLSKIARLAVRFLDNCIDVNTYVLKEIEEEELKTRRIGLGIMGFADFLIKKKIIYGSDECIKSISKLMSFFAATVNEESETLGRVKGIPSALVNAGIMRRNGTLTCIAPTGSISLIAGCSSGCEPIFSFDYKKVCVDTELSMITKCKKDPYYISALNVSPRQHVRVLAEFQRYIDAGVSKTVNLPNSTTEKEVGELLLYAYKLGCKSLTVYRQGSRDVEALVETGMEKEETNIEEKKIANKVKRPNIIHGITRRMVLGEGVLYVTINELNGNPFEVFVKIGKSGGRDAAFSEALGRLASLALRSGVPISNVVTTLQNITGDIVTWNNGVKITSIPDALSYILREFYETSDKPIIEKYKKVYEVCPDCSSDTKHEEGCVKCTNDTCGWSQCG